MVDVANRIYPIPLAYCGKCCTNCCEGIPSDGCTATTNLRKCSSCNLAYYCSKTCQKADWKKHKVECKVLNLFKMAYDRIPVPNDERWRKADIFLSKAPMMLPYLDPENSLGITPEQINSMKKERFFKFAMFSRACSICLRNEFTTLNSATTSTTNKENDNNNNDNKTMTNAKLDGSLAQLSHHSNQLRWEGTASLGLPLLAS